MNIKHLLQTISVICICFTSFSIQAHADHSNHIHFSSIIIDIAFLSSILAASGAILFLFITSRKKTNKNIEATSLLSKFN